MPDIEFAMFKYTHVSEEDFKAWQERLPNAKLVRYGDEESTGNGWRSPSRIRMIRIAFSNWPSIVRYERYNDMDFEFGGKLYPITYYVKED
jgi:hypothetical protein